MYHLGLFFVLGHLENNHGRVVLAQRCGSMYVVLAFQGRAGGLTKN